MGVQIQHQDLGEVGGRGGEKWGRGRRGGIKSTGEEGERDNG